MGLCTTRFQKDNDFPSQVRDPSAQGKRFSTMDETAMKNAENLMLEEFGMVLGMEPDAVRNFIAERVGGEA